MTALVFGILFALSFLSALQGPLVPVSSATYVAGIVQLLFLIPLLALTFMIGAFTPRLKISRGLVLGITSGLAVLGFSISRVAAAFLFGSPMPSQVTISLLNLAALLSAALFTLAAWQEWNLFRQQALQTYQCDPLTGLLNRQGFRNALRSPRLKHATLAVIDVNRLKAINDLHGHSAGDNHLQNLATGIRDQMSEDAALCRWGGDEFLAAFPGTDQQEAAAVLTQARASVSSLIPGTPPFSFGISALGPDLPFEQAFVRADHQMYAEKQRLEKDPQTPVDDLGLYDFSRRLDVLTTPEEVRETGLRMVRTLLQFDVAIFSEVKDGKLVVRNIDEQAGLALPGLTPGLTFLPGPSAKRAIQSRRTVINIDYPNDPLSVPVWVEAGVKTAIMTPIVEGQTVTGLILLLHTATWKVVTPATERILQLAALKLGHAVELYRVAESVRLTLEGGLLALGIALEARDLETSGHTERVVQLAVRLGAALGLRGSELDELRQGAFLHDIGKLSVPDAILLKPGKLNPEEWVQMKNHVISGADIASRIPNLSPGALDVIRHHHERWDGAGYPDGLAGEDISLLARIFTVCDVFDALTHERIYKRAWSVEDALAEIASQRERQFCPKVVDAFLHLIRDDLSAAPPGRATEQEAS
ncbi:HD domain-containing phosphohydrolase [Deinococcus altitudinis]|uniref:HD domain-containing phosphohydrolase n=1 Tax=Deinococcus altitudinis TaxID=468914 RepID=UPI0038918A66